MSHTSSQSRSWWWWVFSCHAWIQSVRERPIPLWELLLMFTPKSLLLENGIIFKVNPFPRVSLFEPSGLLYKSSLVLKVRFSMKIKPLYKRNCTIYVWQLIFKPFWRVSHFYLKCLFLVENSLFSNVSHFPRVRYFSQIDLLLEVFFQKKGLSRN